MIKIPFEDKIILFFLYDERVLGATYEYYLNGEKVGVSQKSHYIYEKLSPNTVYKLTVCRTKDHVTETVYDESVSTIPLRETVDVTKSPYFAKNDGKTLCTKQIQQVIDASVGKTVYFPKGTYLTGALFLKSGTKLCLEEGAVILGSDKPEDYLPKIPSRFEGIEGECYASLINIGKMNHDESYTTKNVVICGKGTIRGGGNALKNAIVEREKTAMKEYLEEFHKENGNRYSDDVIAGRARGRLINVSNSKNVLIEGVSLEEGPAWNVHILYSENVVTTGCTFRSFGISNGDGWDPDSSKYCILFNCLFDMGDDCIAIKSGKNPEGDVIARPSENIYVFDCKATAGHGCAIGSEMSGGVKNVFVWDCDFKNTLYGLHIKTTKKRGGYIRDVIVDNCSFPCIKIDEVGYNDDGEGAKELPVFENFQMKNLVLSGVMYLAEDSTDTCYPVYIKGLKDDGTKFRSFLLENIVIERYDEIGELIVIENAVDVALKGVFVKE